MMNLNLLISYQTLKIKNHITILQEKDLLSTLSDIEEKIDEPLNDPSIIPTYLVSKLAKEHVKVALSGDGADELFMAILL